MSKNPAWPEVDISLVNLLESSLHVQCLDAGSNLGAVQTKALTYPYTLIGQNTQTGLIVTPLRGKPVHIEPGGGYILPEGQRIKLHAIDDRPQLFHWSHLHIQVLGNLNLFDIAQSPYGVDPEQGSRIGELNQQLAKLGATSHLKHGHDLLKHIAARKIAAAKMLALVLELCPVAPGAMQKLLLLSRFERVFEFMADNLHRPVFRDELSDIADLSPSRFHACFLEATGQSPMAYVTQLRLRKAQELLLGSAASVQSIAHDVGFRDPFHFSRTFNTNLGLSPSQYRQRARQGLMNEGESQRDARPTKEHKCGAAGKELRK